jgi:hypothetical protein
MPTSRTEELLSAQELTQSDLEHNRRGMLTETQRERMRSGIKGRANLFAAIVALDIVAMSAGVVFAMREHHSPAWWIVLAIALPVAVAVYPAMSALLARPRLRALEDGNVEAVIGQIDRIFAYRGLLWVRIDRTQFMGRTTALANLLHKGDSIRLHRLVGTRNIVSIE